MGHTHVITDDDAQFVVDVTTREIINKTNSILMLMQYDHDSERFTFEIPRIVEGHDMYECDKIEVHYSNIGKTERSEDIYIVDDVSTNGDNVVFSWLIPRNATRYAGTLNFLIRFVCFDENDIAYVWNTAVYSGITVVEGMNNTEKAISGYVEKLIADFKKTLDAQTALLIDLDERLTAIIPKTYTVDLSQLNFGDDYYNGGGCYINTVIIDGNEIQLTPSNSNNLVKYDGVTSLVIGVAQTSQNSVTYEMGGTTYTQYPVDMESRGKEEHTVELTDDVVIVATNERYCLTGDTLITMADGTYKRIDEIEVGESVRAIDPETLEIVADTVTYSDVGNDKTNGNYDAWTFSDGTIIKTVARHRFYNIERQAMVYMDEWKIGEHAYNEKGEAVALVSHERVNETVNFYTIFTEKNSYFANGLLSGNRRTKDMRLEAALA